MASRCQQQMCHTTENPDMKQPCHTPSRQLVWSLMVRVTAAAWSLFLRVGVLPIFIARRKEYHLGRNFYRNVLLDSAEKCKQRLQDESVIVTLVLNTRSTISLMYSNRESITADSCYYIKYLHANPKRHMATGS